MRPRKETIMSETRRELKQTKFSLIWLTSLISPEILNHGVSDKSYQGDVEGEAIGTEVMEVR